MKSHATRVWRRVRRVRRAVLGRHVYSNRSTAVAIGEPLPDSPPSAPTFRLLDLSGIERGSYRLVRVPREFDHCPTSEQLGVAALPLIRLVTADGCAFVDLCMPEGYDLVYMRQLQPQAWLHAYYTNDFDKPTQTAAEDPAFILKNRAGNKVEVYCRPFLKPGSRVLDVGCGYGDQLHIFKTRGHDAVGIEPNASRAAFGRTHFGLDIHGVDFQNPAGVAEFASRVGRFDLIYLNQVLEHLTDPIGTMRQLRGLLAPGGKVFIAVPDFKFEGLLVKLLSPVHSHSFTGPGLVAALAAAGLRLERNFDAEYYNLMLFDEAPERRVPTGGGRVLDEVRRFFALDRHAYRGADVLVQVSNTLGDWSAVSRYAGPPLARIDSNDALRAHLPAVIDTGFDEPRLLYK